MKVGCVWSILLIKLTWNIVSTYPVRPDFEFMHDTQDLNDSLLYNKTITQNDNGEIISVRITSSVAVERKGKNNPAFNDDITLDNVSKTEPVTIAPSNVAASEKVIVTELPPDLSGANLEFIKQLNAKKEARALQNDEKHNPEEFHNNKKHQTDRDIGDISISTELVKKPTEVPDRNDQDEEYSDNVPIARSIPFYPKEVANYNEPIIKSANDNKSNLKVTSVSFQVIHDLPKVQEGTTENSPTLPDEYEHRVDNPPQYFNEPSKIYSQPAKIYSVPAKFYSEPAKVYGEPAKIYSEPAKVYSEPAKIYSVPAKFYSQPASLHLEVNKWNSDLSKSDFDTPVPNVNANSEKIIDVNANSEKIIDEFVKIEDNNKFELNKVVNNEEGKAQNGTTENNKVGYVVEGKDFRKYRVEERTSDGFIVGEYGVVRNEDGALRGVRYTADGEASPSLIYDGLMKFLQL